MGRCTLGVSVNPARSSIAPVLLKQRTYRVLVVLRRQSGVRLVVAKGIHVGLCVAVSALRVRHSSSLEPVLCCSTCAKEQRCI